MLLNVSLCTASLCENWWTLRQIILLHLSRSKAYKSLLSWKQNSFKKGFASCYFPKQCQFGALLGKSFAMQQHLFWIIQSVVGVQMSPFCFWKFVGRWCISDASSSFALWKVCASAVCGLLAWILKDLTVVTTYLLLDHRMFEYHCTKMQHNGRWENRKSFLLLHSIF